MHELIISAIASFCILSILITFFEKVAIWRYNHSWATTVSALIALMLTLLSYFLFSVDKSSIYAILFGILLGLFSLKWLYARTRGDHEDDDTRKLFWLRQSELSFGGFILVLIAAITFAGSPDIMRAISLTVNGDGSFNINLSGAQLEQRSARDGAISSGSAKSGQATPKFGPRKMELLAGQVGRDINYVCALASNKSVSGASGCADATSNLKSYELAARETVASISACFTRIANDTLDRELSIQVIRPVVLAYKRFANAQPSNPSAGAPDKAEILARNRFIREVSKLEAKFERQGILPYIGAERDSSCKDTMALAKSIAEKIDGVAPGENLCTFAVKDEGDHLAKLCKALELDRTVPYGRMAYAMQVFFMGDTLAGVVALQDWLDRSRMYALNEGAHPAERAWLQYVAKLYQNILLKEMPSVASQPSKLLLAMRFETGAKELLKQFSPWVLATIESGNESCQEWFEGVIKDPEQREQNLRAALIKIYFQHFSEIYYQLSTAVSMPSYARRALFEDSRRSYLLKNQDKALGDFDELSDCFENAINEKSLNSFRAEYLSEGRAEYEIALATHLKQEQGWWHEGKINEHLKRAKKYLENALRLMSGDRPDTPPVAPPDREALVNLILSGDLRTKHEQVHERKKELCRLLD